MNDIINDEYIKKMFFLDDNVQGHDKEVMQEDTHRYVRRILVIPYENKFAGKSYNPKKLNNDVYEYVANRFRDSESFSESLFRIVKRNEDRPVCLSCGGKVNFEGLGYGFKDTCCKDCRNKLRAERMQKNPKKEKQAKEITELSQVTDDIIIKHFFDGKTAKETSSLLNTYITYEVRGIADKRSTINMNIYRYLKDCKPKARSLGEALYMIKNNIDDIPKCPVCGDPLPFKSLNDGYCEMCSKLCRTVYNENASQERKEARTQARLNEHVKSYEKEFGIIPSDGVVKGIFGKWNFNNSGGIRWAYMAYGRGIISVKHVIYKDVYEYIMNRFNDSESFVESLYRILNDVEKHPLCEVCGRPVEFLGKPSGIWRRFCSAACQYEYNEAHNLMHGPSNSKGNTSLSEEYILNEIRNKTGLDVISGYTCDKYYGPNIKGKIKQYVCDGYIPELDLYIEYQGFLAHGGKPFDGTNNEYDRLFTVFNSKFDKDIADAHMFTATVSDVCRRMSAKHHGLLYLELWDTDRSAKHLVKIIEGINEMKGKSYDEKVEIIKHISKFKTIYDKDMYVGKQSIIDAYESNELYNIQIPVKMNGKKETSFFYNTVHNRNLLYNDELCRHIIEISSPSLYF